MPMHMYITNSQIPELKPLTPHLRRVVFRRALDLLRSHGWFFYRLPSLLCFAGGVAGSFLGSALFRHFHPARATVNGELMVQCLIWSLSAVGIVSFSAA